MYKNLKIIVIRIYFIRSDLSVGSTGFRIYSIDIFNSEVGYFELLFHISYRLMKAKPYFHLLKLTNQQQ